MKKIIYTLCFILAASVAEAAIIIINISAIQPIAGQLSMALDTQHTYDKDNKSDSFFTARKTVSADTQQMIIKDVSPGRYAISIFHDANDNSVLDSNLFGVPTEAYGFSNNIVGHFGKPNFEQTSFVVGSGQQTVVLDVRLIR